MYIVLWYDCAAFVKYTKKVQGRLPKVAIHRLVILVPFKRHVLLVTGCRWGVNGLFVLQVRVQRSGASICRMLPC